MNKLKAFISTLGCDKNRVDSEIILKSLYNEGIEATSKAETADFIIINSCAFLQDSIKESLDAFFEAAQIKSAQNPNAKIVMTGCLVSRFSQQALMKDLPEADWIITQAQMQKMGTQFAKSPKINKPDPSPTSHWLHSEATRLDAGYAFIKISEGCDRQCSFCVIPQIRGKMRSFEPAKIAQIIEEKSKAGIKEFNIISQDSTQYGKDLDPKNSLPMLLEHLIQQLSEKQWLRLMYLHPDSITDTLLKLIAGNNALVPYLDIPMQHIAPGILSKMARQGNRDKYLALINNIRNQIPNAAIRSSFIIGYPGETEQDFQQLCDFLLETKLNRVGFFIYSDEPGSKSIQQKPKIPLKIKKERHQYILSLQNEISKQRLTELVGQTVPILVEQKMEKDYAGRTIWDAPEVDGQVFIATTKNITTGTIIDAQITASLDHDLLAEI